MTRQSTGLESVQRWAWLVGFVGLVACAQGNNAPGDPVCGNGVLEPGEQCDDSNTTSGDGCDADCATEGDPDPVCGNGDVETGEDCDDGNTADGDGCSSTCTVEGAAVCSNGVVETGEACDDGNTASGDGCAADCGAVDAGYDCTGEPSVCETVCGDGIIAGLEACDDSNTNADDGCDADCAVETGYDCAGAPSVCDTICGDGLVVGDEDCDDSGESALCDANCTTAQCGDFTLNVTAGEACDDGNTTDGDGCSSTCQSTVCGDGTRDSGEACDDGNTTAGDGCSDTCQLDTLSLKPGATEGKDAPVFSRDSISQTTNYGTSVYLYAMAWTWTPTPGVYRSLIEFPLPAGMQGCTVASATLGLYHYSGEDHSDLSGTNDYQVLRITSAWDETTVTWSNQPGTDAGSAITMPAPATTTANAQLDITSIVSHWFTNAGSNHGILIRLATEDHYRAVSYCSSDHTDPSLHPELEVTFSACP